MEYVFPIGQRFFLDLQSSIDLHAEIAVGYDHFLVLMPKALQVMTLVPVTLS